MKRHPAEVLFQFKVQICKSTVEKPGHVLVSLVQQNLVLRFCHVRIRSSNFLFFVFFTCETRFKTHHIKTFLQGVCFNISVSFLFALQIFFASLAVTLAGT